MKKEEIVKIKKYSKNKQIPKIQNGITLIGLVVTIIVLLILAGVSINTVLGKDGIIKKTQESKERHKMSEAREKLEIELLDAKIEKQVNSKYNENEYLDSLILENIENSKVIGDTAVVDGYAFSLDRSVPKIGEYVGKEEELVFPTVATNVQIAEDCKSATITITAKEEQNGINKIEIIQGGYVIKEYTYENVKGEITENYITKQNGKYFIKVYSKLSVTQIQNITNLVASVKYTPNGNDEYKKEHPVKISITESPEKVDSIKYQWLQTTVEPDSSTFTEIINDGETIKKSEITGQWYLWTIVTTESGKTNIVRSEAFCFDNEAPKVNSFTSTATSGTSFTLTAKVIDPDSGLNEIEFYVNNELKQTTKLSGKEETTATYTATVSSVSQSVPCYIVVRDELGNEKKQTLTAKTKLYTWERYSVNSTTTYKLVASSVKQVNLSGCIYVYYSYIFNSATGKITGNGSVYNRSTYESNSGLGPLYHYCIGSSAMRYYSAYVNHIDSRNKITTWNVIDYTVGTGATTYSKGTTKYSNVTSTSSSAYPTNAKSGSYWYVYKGLT